MVISTKFGVGSKAYIPYCRSYPKKSRLCLQGTVSQIKIVSGPGRSRKITYIVRFRAKDLSMAEFDEASLYVYAYDAIAAAKRYIARYQTARLHRSRVL